MTKALVKRTKFLVSFEVSLIQDADGNGYATDLHYLKEDIDALPFDVKKVVIKAKV